jgi:Fis family transcriptional regulator, factor for inversion stimulation protein
MQKTGILYSEATREFRKQFIIAALKAAQGNRSRAAKNLGMHRNTLIRTMRALGIEVTAVGPERRPPQRAKLSARNKLAG